MEQTNETELRVDKPVKKNHGKMILIGCAVVAVIGVGFGVTGMILWAQEKARSEDLDEKLAQMEDSEGSVEVVEKDDGTKETIVYKNFDAGMLKLRSDKMLEGRDVARTLTVTSTLQMGGEAIPVLEVSLGESVGEQEVTCGENVLRKNETTLQANVRWNDLYEFYDIDRRRSSEEHVTVEGIDPAHVVDIEVSYFGNGLGYETMIFLMDDGTLKYMSIREMAEEGKVRVQGDVKGISDIVRLETVTSSTGCFGGGWTMIAQKANGEFYDLQRILEEQGIWSED